MTLPRSRALQVLDRAWQDYLAEHPEAEPVESASMRSGAYRPTSQPPIVKPRGSILAHYGFARRTP